jgi:hypothetical protein
MKKIIPLLLVVLFIVFVVFGFQAASKLLSGSKNSNSTILNPIPLSSSQQNYLLVHVTELSSDSPELIVVWAVFVYYSNPPQLMFLPLYPTFNTAQQLKLSQSFGLTDIKKLSSRFVDQIEQVYDLKTAGYIISDNSGVTYANSLLTGQEPQISASAAVSDEEKQILLLNGRSSFEQLCSKFTSGEGNSFFSAIDWSVLVPNHFSTNLPFETIALTADLIKRAPSLNHCVVLSNE